MIKELRLKNWKSFADSTLYIDPLTILIGTNAGGKSNVLDALLFLQRMTAGRSITVAIAGDRDLPGIRGGLEWVVRKPGKSFTLEVIVASSIEERTDYRYALTLKMNGISAELVAESLVRLKYARDNALREQNLFITGSDAGKGPISVNFYTGTKGAGKSMQLDRAHSILSQIETLNVRKEIVTAAREVAGCLRQIFILDPVPGRMRNYSPLSDTLQSDAGNIAGVLGGLQGERKKEIEETLTRYLRNLPERDIRRVWTEPVGKFERDAMLYCEEDWTGCDETDVIDARGMSDGTLRFLSIMTAILTSGENSLLVIEEVDNGLHPSRAHVLVEMLRELGEKRGIDVLATTHNPAVLDALGSGMVPFISVVHRDAKSGASRVTLLEEIEQLPKLMASGSVGRLASRGRIEAVLKEKNGAAVS